MLDHMLTCFISIDMNLLADWYKGDDPDKKENKLNRNVAVLP